MKTLLIILTFSTLILAQDSTLYKKYQGLTEQSFNDYKEAENQIKGIEEQLKAWKEELSRRQGVNNAFMLLFKEEQTKLDSIRTKSRMKEPK
jgi:hypothetical protein